MEKYQIYGVQGNQKIDVNSEEEMLTMQKDLLKNGILCWAIYLNNY